MKLVARHPNAIASLIAGGGIGPIVVALAELLGLNLPGPVDALIAGAISSAALFVGREGVVGTYLTLRNKVLYGSSPKPPIPPESQP